MSDERFFQRVGLNVEVDEILAQVLNDYQIGKYQSHELIPIGYEDCNLKLTTSKGDYFLKILKLSRNDQDCQRYADIMHTAVEADAGHPKLHKSKKGYLYTNTFNDTKVRLIIMDYICGKSFYNLKRKPDIKELSEVAKLAANINNIDIKPPFVYDEWAVYNFKNEFQSKSKYLEEIDQDSLRKVVERFSTIDLDNLPKSFVHGDIINTNIIKKGSELYIVDYSVANTYPRIQELAVIACDLCFDEDNSDSFPDRYQHFVNEYQKYNKLTEYELESLDTYTITAHAMHILISRFEEVVNKDDSEENMFWKESGRKGLAYSLDFWK